MPSENEVKAAAKAMIALAQSRREQGREMPSRLEEASAALEAAEAVRRGSTHTGNPATFRMDQSSTYIAGERCEPFPLSDSQRKALLPAPDEARGSADVTVTLTGKES